MDIKLKLTKSAYLVDNWRYTKKKVHTKYENTAKNCV